MPFTKRSISPVNLSLHRLPQNVRENELECVANGTLANLVRQLSSLSKHAEDIFGELYREAVKIEHKTSTFFNRIDRIASKVTQLDSTVEEVSLQDLHLRKPFKSSTLIDQQSLSRQTMPAAMAECYANCDKPPELDKLNPYRTDGKLALKFYTDPDYFFELWRQEMLKDGDHTKRAKNVNRPKSGSGEKKHKSKRHHTRENRQRHIAAPAPGVTALTPGVNNVTPESVYASQHHTPLVTQLTNGRILTNQNPATLQQQQQQIYQPQPHSVHRESLDDVNSVNNVNSVNANSQYAAGLILKQQQQQASHGYYATATGGITDNGNNGSTTTGYGSLTSNNTVNSVINLRTTTSIFNQSQDNQTRLQRAATGQYPQQQQQQHYDHSKYSILSKNQLYGGAGGATAPSTYQNSSLLNDAADFQFSNVNTPLFESTGGAVAGGGQLSPESMGGVSTSSEGATSSSQSKSTSSGGARPSQPPPAPPPPPPPPPSIGQQQQGRTSVPTSNVVLPLTDPLKGQFKRLQLDADGVDSYTEVVKGQRRQQQQQRDRTLSPPDAPIVVNQQGRRHERSASPDLPPPPPPIVDGRSSSVSPPSGLGGGGGPNQAPPPPPPPPPLLTNGFVQPATMTSSAMKKKGSPDKPLAPAPPPPQIMNNPSNAVQSNFSPTAGGAAALLKSPSSQSASSNKSNSNQSANPTGGTPVSSVAAPVDGRSDLLKAIRDGIQLKKVVRKQEKEREDSEIAKGHDVAAILRKRMEDVMGRSESEESASEFEDDWDD